MLRQAKLRSHLLPIFLLTLTLVGAGARVHQLGQHPYGIYQDEAVNGLDALAFLDGTRPLYFEANNGREPLFVYVMAGSIKLFGNTALGIRGAAALLGLLTLPATYLLGRTWLGNHRGGLLAMALLAGLLWHIHLSRVGFRAISLPLLSAVMLALSTIAVQRRSSAAAVGSGLFLGLSAYTYLPARLIPLILILFAVYAFIWHRKALHANIRLIIYGLMAAFMMVLPLLILIVTQPEVVLGRSGQVAIWNEAVHQGEPVLTALQSIFAALGMFVWRGDDIWRHNVPTRPVFDLLISAAFLIGLVVSVRHWVRRPTLAFTLLWIGVMLLPTILAEDAPHFLRAAGVLPLVVLLPAYGLDWLLERYPQWWSTVSVAIVLAISMSISLRQYFGCSRDLIPQIGMEYTSCYATDPVRGYFFQAEATQLAEVALASEGEILLDQRFWDTFPSVRYFLAEKPVTLFSENDLTTDTNAPTTIIAWPFSDLEGVRNMLPPTATVEVINGPQTRGDLEPETYQLYVIYQAQPRRESSDAVTIFANGIALQAVEVETEGTVLQAKMTWSASQPIEEPLHVFVQWVVPGAGVLAQQDQPLGTQFYPALSWQGEHVIIQTAEIESETLTDTEGQLLLGLYNPVSGERIDIIRADVPQDNNALILEH